MLTIFSQENLDLPREVRSSPIKEMILFLAQTADKDDQSAESVPFENILYRMYTFFFLSDLQ